jgi:thiosulfate dehydrogenase [quinone] large subunit
MEKKSHPTSDLGSTLGILLIRLWLGLRALQTGIEKFAGVKTTEAPVTIDGATNTYGLTESTGEKAYALGNYHGVPKALYEKFAGEPLIPGFFLNIYDIVLGPALLVLGITLLLGIATRISLFAMGLLYTSLTFGLILLKQDAGIAWLGVHIILIVIGLVLAQHNRLAILKKW